MSGSILDDALERFRRTGPEAAHGAPNHGPMTAEALIALGRPGEVTGWVDDYRRELGPMPQPPIARDGIYLARGSRGHPPNRGLAGLLRHSVGRGSVADGVCAVDFSADPGADGRRNPRPHPNRSRDSRVERDGDAPPCRGARLSVGVLGRLLSNTARSPSAPRSPRSGSGNPADPENRS